MSGKMSGSKRLLLFDIDGTLIWGGKLWKESFLDSFQSFFPGRSLEITPNFNGRTDLQIARELIDRTGGLSPEHSGIIDDWAWKVVHGYLERSRSGFESRREEIQVIPGVIPLLEACRANPNWTMALLTGNVEAGARLKLEIAGLWNYFDWGVYSDDHWDRYELPSFGVKRALEKTGFEFSGKSVVIIGDTIHDVNCGKSIGVKSIAVGTGRGVDQIELNAAGPDYYFSDFSSLGPVLSAISQ